MQLQLSRALSKSIALQQQITRALGKPVYLQERHFMMAILVAFAIHMLGIAIWVLVPKTKVLEVPVRTLNIKLGEQEEEVVLDSRTVKVNPAAPNSRPLEQELARSLEPTPMPAKPEAVVAALSKAVKVSKDTFAAAKAAEQKKMENKKISERKFREDEKRLETVAVAKPVAPKKAPPPMTAKKEMSKEEILNSLQPKQYVRQQAFDYKTLETAQLAKNGGSALGNNPSSQAEIMARYEQLISAWIQKFKVYPPDARAAGVQGMGILRIRIDRRGNVRFVVLDQSTGHPQLDRAVLDMINKANPLPPMPNDYAAGELHEFKIPVSFKLK